MESEDCVAGDMIEVAIVVEQPDVVFDGDGGDLRTTFSIGV